jgi:hypothetical protein
MMAYLLGTILVFALGPFDWPIDNWGCLVLFLTAVMGTLFIGYRLGVGGNAAGTELKAWRRVLVLGAIATIVMLFPAAYLYTGKMPWEVADAVRDQAAAYRELQESLALTTQGDRAIVAVARAVVAPLTLAAIPLGALHWRDLSWLLRLLLGAAIASTIIFSLLRGTDREIADLIIVILSTSLVAVARGRLDRGASAPGMLRRHRVAILVTAAALATAAVAFVERKEQRIGSNHEICVGDVRVCADYDHALLGPLGDRSRFGLSMAAVYLGQGYFGLSLALTKDFQSTWGLGHSLPLMTYYSALSGNEELYERSYTFRLRDDGWSDLNQWSTMFPWLANDVGFFGVPFVIGVLAWIWGSSWKDAVLRKNDRAAIVFVFMMVLIFYMPANNQLTQTVDAYFAAVFWTVLWLIDRRRARRPRPRLPDWSVEIGARPAG